MIKIVTLLSLIIITNANFSNLLAQEHKENHKSNSTAFHHKNDIAGFFGATYIIESGFLLPTIGLEYVRKINSFIGIGIIGEVELGSHIITIDEHSHEKTEINRETAFLLLPSIYFITGNFVFSGGYGIEFEKNENLVLTRLSLMYILELKNELWFVVPSFSWDHTKHFNGLVYGFSIARRI